MVLLLVVERYKSVTASCHRSRFSSSSTVKHPVCVFFLFLLHFIFAAMIDNEPEARPVVM